MRRFPVFVGLTVASLITAAATGPALAKPVAIERRLAHPDGASLLVHSIELHEDSIVLSVAITNAGDREISLNQIRSFVLADDARGVHLLNPPSDNRELRIPARTQSMGDLVFVGPLAPSVHQLKLSSNAGVGTLDNPHDNAPVFSAALTVSAEADGDGQPQANHPDGAALRVRRIQAGPGGCVVSLLATNGNDRAIRLNEGGSLRLSDDHGSSARVEVPSDNPDLAVPPGNRPTADLVFPCGKIDVGGLVTLTTNRGIGTADNPYETSPILTVQLRAEQNADALLPKSSQVSTAAIGRSRLTGSVLLAAGSDTAAPPPTTATPSIPAPPAAPTAAPPPLPAPPSPTPPPPRPAAPPEAKSSAAPVAPAPPPASTPQLEAALHATKTERGARVVLSADDLFGASGDALNAAAEPLLSQLNELIASSHPREIVVVGHVDSNGNDDAIQATSERRAHAVAAWLTEHAGKHPPHFVEKGYGRTRPLAPNHNADGSDNPDNRAKNRRIEILLRR